MHQKQIAHCLVAFLDNENSIRILIDTDAFCKLAIGGILEDSLKLFGVGLSECGRLPALPHMLRRGSLRTMYGEDVSDGLLSTAINMPVVGSVADSYLDLLIAIPDIDPGEAQLFAKATATDLHLITGDKNSLRALKDAQEISMALSGRIIVLESILLNLCETLGLEELDQRIQRLGQFDNVVRICFSEYNDDPMSCLLSYFHRLEAEVSPITLWQPGLDNSA